MPAYWEYYIILATQAYLTIVNNGRLLEFILQIIVHVHVHVQLQQFTRVCSACVHVHVHALY